ncbi:UNVERIFIED_CONTAM: hypothetical protein HHA_451030 [Hammondia hammondi]|eukprot:XP_008883541.1 hypothetical protein HHA_451030 [Hammondia hammondi]
MRETPVPFTAYATLRRLCRIKSDELQLSSPETGKTQTVAKRKSVPAPLYPLCTRASDAADSWARHPTQRTDGCLEDESRLQRSEYGGSSAETEAHKASFDSSEANTRSRCQFFCEKVRRLTRV